VSYARKLFYLALLGLSACAYIYNEYKKPIYPYDDFVYVCQKAEIEFPGACDDLNPPLVIYSDIIKTAGYNQWRGVYYDDENYIFINPDLKEPQRTITTRHEIGHYIMVKAGLVPTSETCEHERLARKWSGGLWGPDQKRPYRCP
jgi:hypothetical protein